MKKRWICFFIFIAAMIFALGSGIATADVEINETHFPDEVFRTYVQESFDTDSNNVLSNEEISRVTAINCWGMGIQSMKGLESFPFVTRIEIGDNQLTELDLSTCEKLEELNCYHNQLIRLDLSACPRLSGLICSANRLSSLDVSRNTALEYLKCYETPTLTNVNLGTTSKPALSILVLHSDGLNTLDIRNCPKLVSLTQGRQPSQYGQSEGINAFEWENNDCWFVIDKGVQVRITDSETFDGGEDGEDGEDETQDDRRFPLLDILSPASGSEQEAGTVEVFINYRVTNCIFWPVGGVSDTSRFLSYVTPTKLTVWYNDEPALIASETIYPEGLTPFTPSSETHVADLNLTRPGSYTITATVPGHSLIPLNSRSSSVTFTVNAPPETPTPEPTEAPTPEPTAAPISGPTVAPPSEPSALPEPTDSPAPADPSTPPEEEPDTVTVKGLKYKLNSRKKTAAFIKPTDKKIASVILPDVIKVSGKTYKVTEIAANACKGMGKLTKVAIGKNIIKIGKSAFYSCKMLKTVSGGAGVTSIGDSAFKGCKVLPKITLGTKVKSIGKNAFQDCAKLKTITIRTKLLKNGSVGANAFKGIYSKPTVTCPKGMAKTYKKLLQNKGMPKKAVYK